MEPNYHFFLFPLIFALYMHLEGLIWCAAKDNNIIVKEEESNL